MQFTTTNISTATTRRENGSPTRSTTPGRRIRQILLYIITIVGAVVMLIPFIYMISVSLTPDALVLQVPPKLIPAHPTFANYIDAWNAGNFGQAFFNSVFVACSATALHVLLATMLAFIFARYRFPGRNIMFYGMLATLAVPSIVLIIPQYVQASRLGLTNNLPGLSLIYASGVAFSVFLLRGFFEDIPQELFDSAAIDGGGVLRSFISIALPLSMPAVATVVIFSFGQFWDELILALTLTSDPSLYTLPVTLEQFYQAHTTNWGIVFAGATIAALPVIIIFLIFQRYYINGIAGAIKG